MQEDEYRMLIALARYRYITILEGETEDKEYIDNAIGLKKIGSVVPTTVDQDKNITVDRGFCGVYNIPKGTVSIDLSYCKHLTGITGGATNVNISYSGIKGHVHIQKNTKTFKAISCNTMTGLSGTSDNLYISCTPVYGTIHLGNICTFEAINCINILKITGSAKYMNISGTSLMSLNVSSTTETLIARHCRRLTSYIGGCKYMDFSHSELEGMAFIPNGSVYFCASHCYSLKGINGHAETMILSASGVHGKLSTRGIKTLDIQHCNDCSVYVDHITHCNVIKATSDPFMMNYRHYPWERGQ